MKFILTLLIASTMVLLVHSTPPASPHQRAAEEMEEVTTKAPMMDKKDKGKDKDKAKDPTKDMKDPKDMKEPPMKNDTKKETPKPKAGGELTPESPADDIVKKLIKDMTHDICTKLQEVFGGPLPTPKGDPFEAISYRAQISDGTNYFIKVKLTGDGSHWHVKLNNPLDGPIQFKSIVGPKKDKDPLKSFE